MNAAISLNAVRVTLIFMALTSDKHAFPWLRNMLASARLQWNMTYGGSGLDNGYALLQTSDGGYVLTGTTNSFGAGGTDVWLAKVDASGVIPEFPSWLLLSLALAATGFIVFGKKKLFRRP